MLYLCKSVTLLQGKSATVKAIPSLLSPLARLYSHWVTSMFLLRLWVFTVWLIRRCWGFSACSWGTLMRFSPVADQFRSFFNYIFCSVLAWSVSCLYSMLNRVWRGGNLTHMFSRHWVFVSCQRHVCSLCVNVTPSVRMSVASMAGKNWLRRNETMTFFFFINWNFLIWLERSHSGRSQQALKLERNIGDKHRSNQKTIRLFEAELCRPRCGEIRPIPQAKYWLKVYIFPAGAQSENGTYSSL